MDWLADGIQNTFSLELIDVNDLEQSYGWFDGNVTGGKITEGYYADHRIAATLDVEGITIADNQCVRIWHTATLGAEQYTHELGTFMVNTSSMTLERGIYTGTIDLESMLAKYSNDLRANDRAVSGKVVAFFYDVVRNAFGVPQVNSGVPGDAQFSPWVWEFGDSVYSALQTAADACNARLDVDTHGRTILTPYTAPSQKDMTFTIDGMVLTSGFTNEVGDIVNRVVVEYQQNGKDDAGNDLPAIFGSASVAENHPWHPNKIGRWYTKSYTESEPSDPTQTGINNLAQRYLNDNLGRTSKWEGNGIWLPYKVGEVGWVDYTDSDTGESKQGRMMIQQKEYNLDYLMQTKYIFNELDV